MKINAPPLLHCLLSLLLPFAPVCRGEEESPPAEAKASVMSPREKPLELSKIKELAPEAKVKVSVSPDMTSYTVEWKEAAVVLNVREDYDQKVQNEGAIRWIAGFTQKERDTPAAAQLQKFIPSVKRTYGVRLPKGFDAGGLSSAFLLKVAAEFGGFAFTGNSFYDREGFKILGPPQDPPFFGRAGRNILLFDKPSDPKELLIGKWDTEVAHTEVSDGITMQMHLTAVDEYQADGVLLSVGKARLTITPDGTEEATGMSFDFTSAGRWSVKNQRLELIDGGMKTNNHHCENPALEEGMEELVKELGKAGEDGDPEINWLISRDRDLVILEETELGVSAVMKRRK